MFPSRRQCPDPHTSALSDGRYALSTSSETRNRCVYIFDKRHFAVVRLLRGGIDVLKVYTYRHFYTYVWAAENTQKYPILISIISQ